MSSNLTIYKASAGSGKTFRLVLEYIKILIENPSSYRNILAVTFTNKATAEMKSRILSELYGLAMQLDESKKYLQILCAETKKSEDEIARKSTQALTYIIHDYNRFRVETIDSFLQTILRNMARELGINARFNLNLDDAEVLHNTVGEMIEKSSNDAQLINWLRSYIEQKIDDEKSWKIETDIENFYGKFISDEFKSQPDDVRNRLSDKNFISKFKNSLYAIRNSELAKMKKFATDFFEIIESDALQIDDFSRGKSGVCGYFLKLQNEDFIDSNKILNVSAQKGMENAESWATKTSNKRDQIIALAESKLMPLLNTAENERIMSAKLVNTCNLILSNLNNLGLLGDILENINVYNKEKNYFSLSDTSVLLAKMIGDDDTSFIFEKTGVTLQHIMIDEFQDTSRLQWKNFEMLLSECLSQGKQSLIVGDVKQAIYRWRDGDWQILNNIEHNKKLQIFNPQIKVLNTSWRSAKNIIDFNNNLYSQLIELLKSEGGSDIDNECNDLSKAYSDVYQECKRTDIEGYVSINFFEKDDYEKSLLNGLVEKIETLQSNGVAASDITILVREKKHIKNIADYLAAYSQQNIEKKYCYNLVSNEAFTLDTSIATSTIINALQYINNNENTVAFRDLVYRYQKNILNNDVSIHSIFAEQKNLLPQEFTNKLHDFKLMPLYELIENLFSIFELNKLNETSEYMFTFLDKTSEYLQRESSDISSFLEFWDEKLCRTNIAVGDDVDGIKIMTIHKSKGLEFHSVILAFCDWPFVSNNKKNFVWCKPNTEPFSEIGYIPIEYGNAMSDSIFSEDYESEHMKILVDNVNLLYVATTRAKNNLAILSKSEETANINNAAKLLNSLFAEDFENGFIQTSKKNTTKISENKFQQKAAQISVPFVSNEYKVEFKQSNKSRDFIDSGELLSTTQNYIDRGKLFHKIFAEISTEKDIDAALLRLQFEGVLCENEKTEYRNFVLNAIRQSQVEQWYSGSYKLFSECTIITKNEIGELVTKRPDRVMINENNTIVIDFKFGKPRKTYNAQVAEYMTLMQDMNYKNVRGYLWYVDENLVEEIKL